MEVVSEKEKTRISSDNVIQDKVVTNQNKNFSLNQSGGDQQSRNHRPWGRSLSSFRGSPLRVSLA